MRFIIYMNAKTSSYSTKTEGALNAMQNFTPNNTILVTTSSVIIATFHPHYSNKQLLKNAYDTEIFK